MCKASDEIITLVSDLMELRGMIEELQTEAEDITDKIKAFMGDEEVMVAGCWKVSYKETISHRLDTKELKKILGDALECYYKTIVTRPFKVS